MRGAVRRHTTHWATAHTSMRSSEIAVCVSCVRQSCACTCQQHGGCRRWCDMCIDCAHISSEGGCAVRALSCATFISECEWLARTSRIFLSSPKNVPFFSLGSSAPMAEYGPSVFAACPAAGAGDAEAVPPMPDVFAPSAIVRQATSTAVAPRIAVTDERRAHECAAPVVVAFVVRLRHFFLFFRHALQL